MVDNKTFINFRLTSLWALSEIGGSLLNVLKVPLSGLFVSACTVLILALFYQENGRNERPVAIGFLVVVVLKFLFNIIGSPLAFLALFFQVGFTMICFRYIRSFERACIVAAVTCLLHSCLQQLFLRHGDPDFWSLKTAFLPMAMLDRVILEFVKSSPVFMALYVALFVMTGWVTGKIAPVLWQLIRDETNYINNLESLPKIELTEKQKAKLEKKRLRLDKRKAKGKSESNYGFPRFMAAVALLLLITGNFKNAIGALQVSLLWLAAFTDFFQKHVIPRILRVFTRVFYPQYTDHPESEGNFGDLRHMVTTAWLIAKEERYFLAKVYRLVPLIFALALERGKNF